MPPRRARNTQGAVGGTSNPLGDNTPQLNSGTTQQEGIHDPTGNTPTVQEPNMTQLMQTLIGVVQTQQQLLQQQHAQPRQHFPPTPGHGEHPMQRNNIVEFKKLAPPAFKGTIKPLEADNWIMEMEKAFAVQECHDEEKIRYTAYLLQGEAYNWWRILEQKYEYDRIPLTWERFRDEFFDKYFPRSVRIQKEQEFIHLKQGNRSVAEYEVKFTELAKFVPRLVEIEQDRVHKFEMRLKTEIKRQVVPYELNTYASVVNKALIIEREVNEAHVERE